VRACSVVVALVGCSFHHGPEPARSDGPLAADARPPADGASDAPDARADAAPTVPISFVQGTQTSSGDSMAITLQFAAVEHAGDLNVVVVSYQGGASLINVQDTEGNAYTDTGLVNYVNNLELYQDVWYAPSIAGGVTQVTASFDNLAVLPELRIAEYSGIAAVAPLDGLRVSGRGTGQILTSAMLTTTHAHDLLVAADFVGDFTDAVDPTFTWRHVLDDFGDVVEDREVMAVGSYQATAHQGMADDWLITLLAFKAAQ